LRIPPPPCSPTRRSSDLAGVMVIGLRHVFDGMGTDLDALSNLRRAVQLGLRTRQLPFPQAHSRRCLHLRAAGPGRNLQIDATVTDRKSTRLNSSQVEVWY